MTKTSKTQAAETASSPMAAILAIASKFSAAERLELLRNGVVVPHCGESADPLSQVWGYRCRHCGGLSLHFLGSRFVDGQGNEQESPPTDVPIAMLPWVQTGDVSKMNRHSPTCQNHLCAQPVHLHDGKFLMAKMIVSLVGWAASRVPPKVRRTRQLVGVAAPEPLSDGWVDPPKLADMIHPSTRQQAEQVAARHGLDDVKVS